MTKLRTTIVALSVASICLAVLGWIYLDGRNPAPEPTATGGGITGGIPAAANHPSEESTISSSHESKLLHRSADTRWKNLQFLDPGSLKMSSEAIEYLKLTPAQVTEANLAIETFKKDLFKQELSRAVVEVKANGDEEIVVPAFDRRAIHAALRSDVTKWAGPDLTKLIADLMSHDAELGAVNTELRVSIQKGGDGRDRLIYTRRVLAPDAYDPDIPINRYFTGGPRPDFPIKFSSTANVRTEALLTDTLKPRVKFLLDAAGALPKQSR